MCVICKESPVQLMVVVWPLAIGNVSKGPPSHLRSLVYTSPTRVWYQRISRRSRGSATRLSVIPGGRPSNAKFVGAKTVSKSLINGSVKSAMYTNSHRVLKSGVEQAISAIGLHVGASVGRITGDGEGTNVGGGTGAFVGEGVVGGPLIGVLPPSGALVGASVGGGGTGVGSTGAVVGVYVGVYGGVYDGAVGVYVGVYDGM
mmetsp:Transcript_8023/g.23719  ORF Transcript_8023/g.23719 Transcript_8023/m.23719 type:complete len:202 (+) Transcript_8023:160-765(+)